MKFSLKLSIAIVLLLAVFLSLTGTLLVRRSFQSSLDNAVQQSTGQHLLEKYAFEADLLDIASRDEAPSDEHLRRFADSITGYFEADERMFALYSTDMEELFSNLPPELPRQDVDDTLEAGSDQCLLRSAGNRYYLLMASRIDTPARGLWLLSAFDVSVLYAERETQLRYLWQLELVMLVLAVLISAVLSTVITRPLKKLARASKKIAAGAYGGRTGVNSRDEIGELARDFDVMAQAVEEKVDALNASVQQRDDFVSAFTHEIKTPMTSLIGYSGILRSAEYEPKVRQKAATYIYHEAKRLESLSQKLLELMGLSQDAIDMRAVRLDKICAVTARSVEPLLDGVQLSFEGEDGLEVMADPELVADLLRNLILNAVKSGPKDGAVHIIRQTWQGNCLVAVRDTGCGIPGEELERITEPFYMVDKSRARQQGGSGIGLSLGKKIAQMHGSELRFRSEVGMGTTVAFSLPFVQREEKGERKAEGEQV